ncbi:MAG: hypothetical protein ACMUHY_05410 [Thermoplasmatota archaeon]
MRRYNWYLIVIMVLVPLSVGYVIVIVIWNYFNPLSTFDVICNTIFLVGLLVCGAALELLFPWMMPLYVDLTGPVVRFRYLYPSMNSRFDVRDAREVYLDSMVGGKHSSLAVVRDDGSVSRYEYMSYNMKEAVYSLRDGENVRMFKGRRVVDMREDGRTLRRPPEPGDLERGLSEESRKLARKRPGGTEIQDRMVLKELESLEKHYRKRRSR